LKEVWFFEGWKGKFEDNFAWEVGNGRDIRFWEDKWVGNVILKDKFLRLFSICTNKDSRLWQGRERDYNLEWFWKIG